MLEYRTVKVVDSRTCRRCGSRYGFCPHTEGQRADSTIDVPRKSAQGREAHTAKWPEDRLERLIQLYERGYTPTQIADILSTTRGAVAGQLTRAGIYGRAA